MKSPLILSLLTLNSSLLTLSAAVPLEWTVETSRASLAKFDEFAGATYDLEATLQSKGRPLEVVGDPHLYWQTNGMDSFYWSAPATVSGNVLRATWTPSMETGARAYNCFIGITGTVYNAAFQLCLRPSPGAIPNVLPLPVPVIDFAKVRVLNPPWTPGGGGVDTNAVIDIIRETVAGEARPLPPYLHLYEADDSYPSEAQAYYDQRQGGGSVPAPQCSAVRDGGFLSRNFDYPFDDRAEFVVKLSAGPERYASIGVANVGTNLTESYVTSGKPSRWYKALPGATVDGINENGVVAEINVVDGPVTNGWHTTGDLHPLAAVRWALDHATNAGHAATYLAANIRFPEGWRQNFHYMIADSSETWFVEDGHAAPYRFDEEASPRAVLTNYKVVHGMGWPSTWWYLPYFTPGDGSERLELLIGGGSITNVWYTNAYRRETNPPWVSDLSDVIAHTNEIFDAWATHPKEYFRSRKVEGRPWWQTVHTSIYDITNRVLRVAVQEIDDWYTFALAKNGTDEAKVRDIAGEVVAPVASSVSNLTSSVSDLSSSKRDLDDYRVFVRASTWSSPELSTVAQLSETEWELTDGVDPDHAYLWWDASVTKFRFGLSRGQAYDSVLSTETDVNATTLYFGDLDLTLVRTWGEKVVDTLALASSVAAKYTKPSSGIPASDLASGVIPTALKNPYALTFSGVAYGTYDGSSAKTIHIPSQQASDWEQDDPVAVDYIKNKPTIPAPYVPSAADPVFSNAVLAVGIDTNVLAAVAASTNAVAQIGEFYAAFSDIGLTPTQGGMTLAGLLAALVAAVTWLKKVLGKVAENDGTATDQFAADLMGKPVAINAVNTLIDAKVGNVNAVLAAALDGSEVS